MSNPSNLQARESYADDLYLYKRKKVNAMESLISNLKISSKIYLIRNRGGILVYSIPHDNRFVPACFCWTAYDKALSFIEGLPIDIPQSIDGIVAIPVNNIPETIERDLLDVLLICAIQGWNLVLDAESFDNPVNILNIVSITDNPESFLQD